jgi:hypothetical protein
MNLHRAINAGTAKQIPEKRATTGMLPVVMAAADLAP